jgi:hypothetical protein
MSVISPPFGLHAPAQQVRQVSHAASASKHIECSALDNPGRARHEDSRPTGRRRRGAVSSWRATRFPSHADMQPARCC